MFFEYNGDYQLLNYDGFALDFCNLGVAYVFTGSVGEACSQWVYVGEVGSGFDLDIVVVNEDVIVMVSQDSCGALSELFVCMGPVTSGGFD